MIEITTRTLPATLDTTPAGMAELLDGLYTAFLSHDRELSVILLHAREAARALAFNRFAERQTARAMQRQRRALLLRHKGRTARQEGSRHA